MHQMNAQGTNALALFLLGLVGGLPLLVVAKRMPRNVYPVALWATALVLLFTNSLVTMYFRMTDASVETYFAHEVLVSGRWNRDLPSPLNAMLSVSILPAMIGLVGGVDLTVFYRWVVPIVASFVPVVMFSVYARQVGHELAFLAAFMFTSQFTFFTWAGLTAKQATASVLLAVFLLLLHRSGTEVGGKKLLVVWVLVGIALSHYGTAYILLFGLLWVVGSLAAMGIAARPRDRSVGHEAFIAPAIVAVFATVSIAWYAIAAQSTALSTLVDYVKFVARNLLEIPSLLRGSETYGSVLLATPLGPTVAFLKVLYALLPGLAALGYIFGLPKHKLVITPRLQSGDRILALYFLVATLSLVAGRMSDLDPGRVLYLAMFVISPLGVAGLLWIARTASTAVDAISPRRMGLVQRYGTGSCYGQLAAVFATLFFAFNSGLVSEVVFRDHPGAAVGLSLPRVMKGTSFELTEYFYRVYTTPYDVSSAVWLRRVRNPMTPIHADIKAAWNALASYGAIPFDGGPIRPLRKRTAVADGEYVYLRHFNISYGVIQESAVPLVIVDLADFGWLNTRNRLYDNAFSRILQ